MLSYHLSVVTYQYDYQQNTNFLDFRRPPWGLRPVAFATSATWLIRHCLHRLHFSCKRFLVSHLPTTSRSLSMFTASPACALNICMLLHTFDVWRSTLGSIQGCDHSQNFKCLVGFHISHRTSEGFPPPHCAQPSVSSRTIWSDNLLKQQMTKLHKKHHNIELPVLPKNSHLFDCNFIVHDDHDVQ